MLPQEGTWTLPDGRKLRVALTGLGGPDHGGPEGLWECDLGDDPRDYINGSPLPSTLAALLGYYGVAIIPDLARRVRWRPSGSYLARNGTSSPSRTPTPLASGEYVHDLIRQAKFQFLRNRLEVGNAAYRRFRVGPIVGCLPRNADIKRPHLPCNPKQGAISSLVPVSYGHEAFNYRREMRLHCGVVVGDCFLAKSLLPQFGLRGEPSDLLRRRSQMPRQLDDSGSPRILLCLLPLLALKLTLLASPQPGTKDGRDRAYERPNQTDCELDVQTLLMPASLRRPPSKRSRRDGGVARVDRRLGREDRG